jgi:multidrug efflux pump subunit AcrA (membrane-fusion protein)
MDNERKIQMEDSPSLETPKKPVESSQEPTPEKKRRFWQKVLPWVIVALVFFIGGMALIYFTLNQTASTSLSEARANLSSVTEQLTTAQLDLEKAKSDLSTTQSDLVTANNELDKTSQLSALYKFQSDVNLARVYLSKLDPSSARQAMSMAADDFTALSNTNVSKSAISGLQAQIDTALTNVEADPAKAMSALDTLYTNLLLISDSIN